MVFAESEEQFLDYWQTMKELLSLNGYAQAEAADLRVIEELRERREVVLRDINNSK